MRHFVIGFRANSDTIMDSTVVAEAVVTERDGSLWFTNTTPGFAIVRCFAGGTWLWFREEQHTSSDFQLPASCSVQ